MKRHGLAAFTIGLAAGVGLGVGTVVASGRQQAAQQTPAQRAWALAANWNITSDDSQARTLGSLVVGFVWTDQDRPVPYPRLVIRDLSDGMIVGTTIGDEFGEFQFEGLGAGTYVIELLNSGVPPGTFAFSPSTGGFRRLDADPRERATTVGRTGRPLESDHVLAVSQPLTVLAGDTVGTFLRVTGSLAPDLEFGAGSPIFESASDAHVGGTGGTNPVSSER